MSLCADDMVIEEDTLDCIQDLPKKKIKLYNKLDTKSKLLVIHALDNGQAKSDVANEYNVHPRTITNIYKQKEFLLEKYAQQQKKLEEARQFNMDQKLLEWFMLQTESGNSISQNRFHEKAQEIVNALGENSVPIDDWLQSFQEKHKIAKFDADMRCSLEIKEEWVQFLSDFESLDVYIGGMFALSHDLDTECYLDGQSSRNYVSMMYAVNLRGTDKQQLAIVGKDTFDASACIKSLPVKYYLSHTGIPQISYSMINDYLENWDGLLNNREKNILLVLDLPDYFLDKFKFENIKLFTTRNLKYVNHVTEKVIECFKYNYRKIQMGYGMVNDVSDYIHMFASAWHSVPGRYIELLCSPKAEGCLFFNINNEIDGDHSLSHWYKMKNIPLDFDQYSDLLDKYIYCDSELQCVNWRIEDDVPSSSALYNLDKIADTSSCMEAYQAMGRLVSYMQEQNAGSVLKHAKHLESIIEYRVLSQMYQSTNKQE